MTVAEAEAVKHFLKPVVAVPQVPAGDAVAGAGAAAERVPYRDRVNQREQAQRVEGQEAARYEDVSYIQATSNIVERLFSRAKLLFSDLRNMDAVSLEMLLMLFCNRSRWDLQTVVAILTEQRLTIAKNRV